MYEGHSDGIIGTLEGLTEKAEGQLDKARKTESTAVQNYQVGVFLLIPLGKHVCSLIF